MLTAVWTQCDEKTFLFMFCKWFVDEASHLCNVQLNGSRVVFVQSPEHVCGEKTVNVTTQSGWSVCPGGSQSIRVLWFWTHQTWSPDEPDNPQSCRSRWWDLIRCNEPPGPDGADCSGWNLEHTEARTCSDSLLRTSRRWNQPPGHQFVYSQMFLGSVFNLHVTGLYTCLWLGLWWFPFSPHILSTFSLNRKLKSTLHQTVEFWQLSTETVELHFTDDVRSVLVAPEIFCICVF